MNNLGKLTTTKKTGSEQFVFDSESTGHSLSDFWAWNMSDLSSNATRGRLAEFIVATALDIDIDSVREEWAAYDLITNNGVKIEVKSAAYLQSWNQKDFSKIIFSIKEAKFWSSDTNKLGDVAIRSADIYVFCLLNHKDKSTLDPLNLDQWEFFVVPVDVLNNYKRSKHSITLRSLETLTTPIKYNHISSAMQEFKA